MSVVDIGRFFVKVKAPYVVLPRGAKKIAAKVARDLVFVVEGFVGRWNETHNTDLDPAQGMTVLLNSGVSAAALFDSYRAAAESTRGALALWQSEKGWDDGWKWLTPEFTTWFIQTVLDKPYRIDDDTTFDGATWLKKTIIEHPRGVSFMHEFIAALRQFLWPNAPPLEESSSVGVSAEQ